MPVDSDYKLTNHRFSLLHLRASIGLFHRFSPWSACSSFSPSVGLAERFHLVGGHCAENGNETRECGEEHLPSGMFKRGLDLLPYR